MGFKVPFWDSRDDFGETALVLVKPEEGRSLAKALGKGWTILMGRHGATVAGTSIRQTVFRTIFSCKNAELQTQAHLLGHVEPLSEKEVERAWDYWVKRLHDTEARAAPAAKAASGKTGKAAVKAKKPVAKVKRKTRR